MLIDLAGLLAAAVLLVTLVALEVKRAGSGAGPDAGHSARPALLGRTVGRKAVAIMWVMYLVLFLPRVLELLT